MYLTPHPSLAAHLPDPPTAVRKQLEEYFGSCSQEAPVGVDPVVFEVTLESLDLPNGSRLINKHAAFTEEEIFFASPEGWTVAVALALPDSARVRIDPSASPRRWLYTLESIFRLLAPSRGLAFVHASGVARSGKGVLLPAWGGTGKTTAAIHFLGAGWSYLGDDLVIVRADGTMFPYPRPLNILRYNIANHEVLKSVLDRQSRVLYYIAQLLERKRKVLPDHTWAERADHLLAAALRRLDLAVNQFIPPDTIFDQVKISEPVSIDLAAFLIGHSGEKIISRSGDPLDLAARMAACLRWEREHYGDDVALFEFAFPELRRAIRDQLDREERIIREAFGASRRLKEINVPDSGKGQDLYGEIMGLIDQSV